MVCRKQVAGISVRCLTLLALTALIHARCHAEYIYDYPACTTYPGAPPISAAVGPISGSYQCEPGGSGSGGGSVYVNYGATGSYVTNTSGDAGYITDNTGEVFTGWYDLLTVGSSVLSPGAPVDLSFEVLYTSTQPAYTYALPPRSGAEDGVTVVIDGPQGDVLNTTLYTLNIFNNSTSDISGSGLASIDLISQPIATTVGGSTNILFELTNFSEVSCVPGPICYTTSDFLDPIDEVAIVTDPTTGQVLSDVSVTGASGTNYEIAAGAPPAATPEPASLLLLATGLAGILFYRHSPWLSRRGRLFRSRKESA